MKKILITLCLAAILVIGSLGGMAAFALVSMEECDRCFQSTMNSLLNEDDVDGNKISAVRKPVYDITLEQLGYEYEFELASGSGYAIIICDDGNYVAIEVMPHAVSPYAEISDDEQCVFVNTMSYFKAVDGVICDIQSGEEITEQALSALEENAIVYTASDIVTPTYATVVVQFQGDPVEDLYYMSYRPPQYYCAGLDGGCAAIAGGNILGYFDRYYDDLIPNHTAGKLYDIGYYYDFEDSNVDKVIETLYVDMKGNNGITEANCKSGLIAYCSRLGYNCSFTTVMGIGKINYSSVKNNLKANRPIILFLNTYHTCNIYFGSDKDTLSYSIYNGNHVMVGFGYRDTTYKLTNGTNSNYRFIYVATGFNIPRDAYFNIDYSTNIVSAYGVQIN